MSMIGDGDQVSSKRVNGTICILSGVLLVYTAVILAICLKSEIPKEATALIISLFSTGLVLLGAGALVDIFKK